MKNHSFKISIINENRDIDYNPSSRQELIPGWSQEIISSSKVLVVGAGALGNELIKNLVLLGVGYIRVVDFDYVVYSNLARSILFRRSDADLKKSKVEAIAERVKKIDPYGYVVIDPINTDITKLDYRSRVFRDIDVIFTALDNLDARLHVNNQAYYLRIPLIDGGMDGPIGSVQVVVPPYTSCLACSLTPRDYKAINQRLKCDGVPIDLMTPKTPAIISTTAVVAGIMTHEFIKLIHGINLFRKKGIWNKRIGEPIAGKRLFFNLSTNSYILYNVPISKSCPNHLELNG